MNLEMIISLLLSGGGVVVWLVRLEGRIKQCERDIQHVDKSVDILTARHEDLDSRVLRELMEVKQALARIEGRLDTKHIGGDK
jgi:hypothetical protein